MSKDDKVLQDLNAALGSLTATLASVGNLRNSFLKELTPEQSIAYSKFEQGYTKLRMAGDLVGAEKLKEKFNEAMK